MQRPGSVSHDLMQRRGSVPLGLMRLPDLVLQPGLMRLPDSVPRPGLMRPPGLAPRQSGLTPMLRPALRMLLPAAVFRPAEPPTMMLQNIPAATKSEFALPKLPTLRRAEPRPLVLEKPDAMVLQPRAVPMLAL